MDLAAHPFLEYFGSDARDRLIGLASRRHFPNGGHLFNEGDSADSLLLVLEGEVELVRTPPAGAGMIIARMGAGDYLGDMGAIDGSVRCAGARAVGPTTIASIPAAPFLDILLGEPARVSLRLFSKTAERLRHANSLFIDEVLRKERLQFLGEMARSIVHDFKNQTMAVQLVAALLDREQRDETVSQSCRMIREQTDQMLNMAQEILEFSRGSGDLQLSPVEIEDLFQDLAFMNADYLRRMKVELALSPTSATVIVDKKRISRALQNLLFNATDALAPAGGRILVDADLSEGVVEIRIADEGPGIPEEIRHTLFDPFVTARKEQGLGLGLTIVRTIVEAHGASIDCDSAPGEGTTFSIRLPAIPS